MHSIRKIGILVISVLAFLTTAAAEESRYSFSITPLAGFLVGRGEEIVFKYTHNDQYLSELLWDLKPLVYAGLAVDFGPRDPLRNNDFYAAAVLKAGLPLKTGIIKNQDWNHASEDYLTHYSRHDAYSQGAFLADLSAGYSWRLLDSLSIGLNGVFSYMYLSWAAKDGFYQYTYESSPGMQDYPPWDINIPKIPIQGTGILYKQHWFIFAPELSLGWKINRLFSLEGSFRYSPLIYLYAQDNHLKTVPQNTFLDICYFGHFFDWGGTVIFSVNNNLDLTLSFSGRHITGLRGDSYKDAGNTGYFFKAGEGGAGFSALDFSFAARFRITGKESR